MEEILSSIKRIIAEDGDAPATRGKRAARAQPAPAELVVDEADDESGVLELTDTVLPRSEPQVDALPEAPPEQTAKETHVPAAIAPLPDNDLVSTAAASASRQSLTTLSRLVVKPEDSAADNTLEGLVREMLRPMLKGWLDENLPELVETMVAKEIKRITGQTL